MDYTKKQDDYAKLKKALKDVLKDYENINGLVDFNVQRSLAEQGDKEAQFILGVLFILGVRDITPHFIFAYMWFSLASSNGNKDGGKFRDEVFKQLSVTYLKDAQDRAYKCKTGNYTDWDKN